MPVHVRGQKMQLGLEVVSTNSDARSVMGQEMIQTSYRFFKSLVNNIRLIPAK